MYSYDCTVDNIVDADTVDLTIDKGFRSTFADRFRLVDIDAPERGQVGWAEGRDALWKLCPPGTRGQITSYHPKKRDPRDSFGRWLVHLWIMVEGEWVDVNYWLVENGYASLWTKSVSFSKQEVQRLLEQSQ